MSWGLTGAGLLLLPLCGRGKIHRPSLALIIRAPKLSGVNRTALTKHQPQRDDVDPTKSPRRTGRGGERETSAGPGVTVDRGQFASFCQLEGTHLKYDDGVKEKEKEKRGGGDMYIGRAARFFFGFYLMEYPLSPHPRSLIR